MWHLEIKIKSSKIKPQHFNRQNRDLVRRGSEFGGTECGEPLRLINYRQWTNIRPW